MWSRLPALTSKSGAPMMRFVRNGGHWNKEWMAGPYPKTEEERIAAAKKYGMLPEEYEPYEDDGFGFGDYPKLPPISKDCVDHWWHYTNDEERRNFKEPIHILDCILQEDRMEWPVRDPGKWKIPWWQMYAAYFGYVFGLGGLCYYCQTNQRWIHFIPRLEKQMPNEGKTHYHYPKK